MGRKRAWGDSLFSQQCGNAFAMAAILITFSFIFNIHTYIEIRALIRRHHIDIVHVHNTRVLISPRVDDAEV